HPGLRDRKVRRGTASIASGPAMSPAEAAAAIAHGRALVGEELSGGLDLVLTGDMGIGNTTAAAALGCALTGLPPERMVGRGTGVDEAGLTRKQAAVQRALAVNRDRLGHPAEALAAVGGLEIAGLVGVILEGARLRRPVVLDGFIAGAAALV